MSKSDYSRLKQHLPDYLAAIGHPVGKKGLLRCPAHADNNPSANYSNRYHRIRCWACGFMGDLVDVIAVHEGLDEAGAVERARALYGDAPLRTTHRSLPAAELAPVESTYMRSSYIKRCQGDLHLTDYHLKRGFSDEFARAHGLGYDKDIDYLLIPIDNGYIRRACSDEAKPRYSNEKGAKIGLFNAAALDGDRQIIVVEGSIDALSIEAVGLSGVALNGCANTTLFLEHIKGKLAQGWTPARPLIVAMDGDRAGSEASERLYMGLQAFNVPCIVRSLAAGTDFNLLLTSHSVKLQLELRDWTDAVDELLAQKEAAAEAEKEAYRKLASCYTAIDQSIELAEKSPPIAKLAFRDWGKRTNHFAHQSPKNSPAACPITCVSARISVHLSYAFTGRWPKTRLCVAIVLSFF